jgi:hypothetical protein
MRCNRGAEEAEDAEFSRKGREGAKIAKRTRGPRYARPALRAGPAGSSPSATHLLGDRCASAIFAMILAFLASSAIGKAVHHTLDSFLHCRGAEVEQQPESVVTKPQVRVELLSVDERERLE